MKITVVGMGAVGGLIAARLAAAGHAVSALARGATLAALREHGLRLRDANGERPTPLHASDDARVLGAQELVIIAVKGQSLVAVAPTLAPLFDADTVIMPAMNGVPWWFMGSTEGADARLASVDPDGRIAAALPMPQVIGCVVHLTCSSPRPGIVQHGFGDRLIIGEPMGAASARVAELSRSLSVDGLQTEPSADIRRDIWFKLWGNMTVNPVSALTGASTDRILDDPMVKAYLLRTMAEAAEIGARIGCPIAQSGEERLGLARQLGAFKTSMLQDVEAGRSLELDALVGAAHEIGQRVGVDMPCIGALLGLSRLMAQTRGLYPV